MKTTILLLLTSLSCFAQAVFQSPSYVASFTSAGTAGVSYLVSENFEGTGAPSGWESGGTGTIDFDYTTSPAPLEGLQSLYLSASTQQPRVTNTLSGAQSEIYAYCLINFPTIPGSTIAPIIFFQSGTTYQARVDITATTGRLTVRCGTANATTTSGISANTLTHVWFHYKKGTGADAIASIGFSTDGTEPTGGNTYASTSSGSSTGDVTLFGFGWVGNSTATYIVDKVRLNTTTIGSNPQ